MGPKVASVTKEIELSHIADLVQTRTFQTCTSKNVDPEFAISQPDLRNLSGKRNDQLTLCGPVNKPLDPNNDIGRLMRVARTQLEIAGKEQAECTDISTLSPIGRLIASNDTTAMAALFQITDAPDIGKATIEGALSIKNIIALKESRHWQEFVTWFHEECAADPAKVGREYVKLLRKAGPLDSPFFKIIRFLIPTALGFVPVIGGAASAALGLADSFGVPKVKEASPKYFIEELEQLAEQQRKIGATSA